MDCVCGGGGRIPGKGVKILNRRHPVHANLPPWSGKCMYLSSVCLGNCEEAGKYSSNDSEEQSKLLIVCELLKNCSADK